MEFYNEGDFVQRTPKAAIFFREANQINLMFPMLFLVGMESRLREFFLVRDISSQCLGWELLMCTNTMLVLIKRVAPLYSQRSA